MTTVYILILLSTFCLILAIDRFLAAWESYKRTRNAEPVHPDDCLR